MIFRQKLTSSPKTLCMWMIGATCETNGTYAVSATRFKTHFCFIKTVEGYKRLSTPSTPFLVVPPP